MGGGDASSSVRFGERMSGLFTGCSFDGHFPAAAVFPVSPQSSPTTTDNERAAIDGVTDRLAQRFGRCIRMRWRQPCVKFMRSSTVGPSATMSRCSSNTGHAIYCVAWTPHPCSSGELGGAGSGADGAPARTIRRSRLPSTDFVFGRVGSRSPLVHLRAAIRPLWIPTVQRCRLPSAVDRAPRRGDDGNYGGPSVKITRMSGITAALAAGALVLSACGSDNTSTSSSAETSAGSSASAAASGGGAATTSSGAAAGGTGDTTFEGAGFACAEGELRSSGSTAQGKVMEQWIADYNALCNANLNAYGGGGSGKGIQDFIGNQVDFAGFGLRAERRADRHRRRHQRCAGNVPFNLPMVTGPIALAYNVVGRRRPDPDPGGPRRHLLRLDRELERPGDRRAQLRASPCPTWPSRPCTAPRTRAPRRTSPST